MRDWGIVREGMRALSVHKLRTFFMMAGTLVGIGGLIVVMAIGRGTGEKVMKRVNNFGPRAIMVYAGGGKEMGPPDMTVTTLTLEDAEAIRGAIGRISIISPMAWNTRMSLKREASQIRSVVWGVEPNWHEAYEWYTSAGEGISAEDVATLARVCLIGKTVKEELFGNENPLDGRIFVNKVGLTVKGVLEERGTSPGGGDFDNRIILPITTAMRRVLNVEHLGAIRLITEDTRYMSGQVEALQQLMRQRHHIIPPQEDDFRIITSIVVANLARGISRTLSILLFALVALSLVIGGVVMMNILLISVGERTREIGLRRALGASRKDIFIQFLTESLAVTLLGMILGSLLGWSASLVLAQSTRIPVVVSWQSFAAAVSSSLLIGVFFGVQPARKAARLHPVDALR